MEGGITRFSSGIAGVAVVLFALMGTIGVGYLLNGSTGLQTVNDYDYVTDVSGLYDYTPVPAYAAYSPATNNYQYSDSLATLGTFTSGISYTPAGAANLNPIVTPESGYHVFDESIEVSRFTSYPVWNNSTNLFSYPDNESQTRYPGFFHQPAHQVSLQDFINEIGEPYDTLTIDLPTYTRVSDGITWSYQPVSVVGRTTSYYWNPSSEVIGVMNSMGVTAIYNTATTGDTELVTTPYAPKDYTINGVNIVRTEPGHIDSITVLANGTAYYDFIQGDLVTRFVKQISEIELSIPELAVGIGFSEIEYHRAANVNIGYMDPNAGVSLDSTPVYWSNSNELGSVTWAFQKPATASSIRVAAMTSDGQTMANATVIYTASWQLSYPRADGTTGLVDLGSGWQAIYVRLYYTGEIQAGPVDGFFNFTNYTLGNPSTYATAYTGNEPIDHCEISGSTTMRFACIGTTARMGVVPGAMFDATFTASTWFPELASVRVSFDSAAYVGSAVRVGSWTMAVDSGTFIGDLQDVDGIVYRADLTQPWAVTWNPGSTSVSFTFTPYQQAGTQTITILADDDSRTVNLDGQWAIDTDLYSVGTHIEEVYEWNFGNWGLDKEQFIVCAMGLTALLAIAFKLARVPFHALDFVVIFLGNLILWVIM